MAVTPDSLTSVTLIEKRCVANDAIAAGGPDGDGVAGGRLVVQCRIDRDHAGVSVDGEPSARVVVQGIGDRVVGGIGVGGLAVMPTAVPTTASSATVLAAASLSVTAPTSNSSTSLMLIVNTWSVNEPSLTVARTVMLRRGAVRFPVDRAGHGHHAGVGVDGKPAAVVVLQAVGDRVVGGIRVTGRGGDADGGPGQRSRRRRWPWRPCR